MDNIITVRQSDGYDELPLYRWRLEIAYNDDVLEIPLQLVPIGEIRGAYSHIGDAFMYHKSSDRKNRKRNIKRGFTPLFLKIMFLYFRFAYS